MAEQAPKQSFLRHWGSLVVLSLALAIIIIDTTLLNVSLTTIVKDLNTDLQRIQWVITAYALTLAAFTITGGRLGDLFGRKNMFLLGAILFAIGSYTASNAHSFGTMLLGESFIEGIGAALMMPATSSLLLSTFHGRERALAFGIWGGIAAAASAIGPILGGYLTTYYSWRWGFRINIVVVIILLLSSYLIKESREHKKNLTLDWVGVILSALGLGSIVFGIVESTTYGWWHAKEVFMIGSRAFDLGSLSVVPVFILIGVVLMGAFTLWELHVERRKQTPLVSPEIFENAQFTSGILTTAVLSLGMAGLLFAVPVFLQVVRGLDALHTGYTFLPLSIALLIAAPMGASFGHKMVPKHLIQIGLLLTVISLILIHNAITPTATAWNFAPGLALYGAGMGLVMSQINNMTLSALPVEYAGEASGVNNTTRQLGSSLGSAIIGAVLLSALSANVTTGVQKSTVIPDQVKTSVISSLKNEGGTTPTGSRLSSGEVYDEIINIRNTATADANRYSMVFTVGFAVLSLLVSTRLPNKKLTHATEAKSAPAAH